MDGMRVSMNQNERKMHINYGLDRIAEGEKRGWSGTKFLSPEEKDFYIDYFKDHPFVELKEEGGFPGAERCRLLFINRSWGRYEPREVVTALGLFCRDQDCLDHSGVLGALMSLGIAREVIGDIDVRKRPGVAICLPEFAPYITRELTKVGRIGIQVQEISLKELEAREIQLEESRLTLTSMRLDVLLSGFFALSRSRSQELINQGLVQVNHQEALKPERELKVGDEVILRKKGKVRILSLLGKSAKDKWIVKMGRYR